MAPMQDPDQIFLCRDPGLILCQISTRLFSCGAEAVSPRRRLSEEFLVARGQTVLRTPCSTSSSNLVSSRKVSSCSTIIMAGIDTFDVETNRQGLLLCWKYTGLSCVQPLLSRCVSRARFLGPAGPEGTNSDGTWRYHGDLV